MTRYAAHNALAILWLVVSCGGCGGTQLVYKAFDPATNAGAQTSTIYLRDAVAATVAGHSVKSSAYAGIELLPGSYSITWECLFGASIMVSPSGFIQDSAAVELLVQPGHSYSMRCERSYGYGYQTYLWISDDTADMLAAGHRKP